MTNDNDSGATTFIPSPVLYLVMATTAPTTKTRSFHTWKESDMPTILEKSNLSDDDKQLVHEFIEGKKEDSILNKKSKHFGTARERRVLQYLRTLREFSPVDFSEITLKHMTKIMPSIEKAQGEKGERRYSQNTYRSTIAAAKMFLTWIVDNDKSAMTEKDLKKIGIPAADEKTVKSDDLLTEETRDAMIKACQNSRDRAIISLMFEAGLRPIEIGQLTFADVEFNQNGMIITTDKKTERIRKIPAPLSKPYLTAWMNDIPYESGSDAVVFCSLTPSIENNTRQWLPLKEDALRGQIKLIAKRAGIKNYKKLYQFRHTAISSWINNGIPERMAMQMSHGGNTQMLRIYYHVTNDEVERRVNALHGIESDKEYVKKEPTAQICPACGNRNPTTLKYCGTCGTILNAEEYQKFLNSGKDTDREIAELKQDIQILRESLSLEKDASIVVTMPRGIPVDKAILLNKQISSLNELLKQWSE